VSWTGTGQLRPSADPTDRGRAKDAFARALNADFLREELTKTIASKPRQHWLDALIAVEVPCGRATTRASPAA
jgi:crotonobetainyl-CoA:carnitine CoA-transferase CaiB-like acyl-CoA transferase